MKKPLVTLLLLFATVAQAGSGMSSSSSRSSSPAPAPATRAPSPSPAPATRAPAPAPAAHTPAPATKAPAPIQAPQATSKSGFGNSGARDSLHASPAARTQNITPQGATNQMMAREASKAAAVSAFAAAEQQKAEAARAEADKKYTAERHAAQQRTREQQSHKNETRTAQTPAQSGTTTVIRERERVYVERNSSDDYWRGLQMGQSMNRPTVIYNQPAPAPQAAPNPPPVADITPPSRPVVMNNTGQQESGFGFWIFILITFIFFAIAGGVYYLFQRQNKVSAAAAYQPKYKL